LESTRQAVPRLVACETLSERGAVKTLSAHARPWHMPDPTPIPSNYLPDEPAILRAMLYRRGLRDSISARSFLNPLQFRFPPMEGYPPVVAAVDRLVSAILLAEPVCVWGDYDADGQTAAALLVGTLRTLGASVSYYVPSRLIDGRGLDCSVLTRLAAEGCKLVLTCDCGTGDAVQVAWARTLGIEVIITDHHQQLGPLPEAVAVCNSSLLPTSDPLWGLPGVGMAYVIARELYSRLGRARDAHGQLDLVALGIIADLAPLTAANRALLTRGLDVMWNRPRPGLRALLDLTGKPSWKLDTMPISYKLAPALNAAGRLADARMSIELLLAEDPEQARTPAAHLWEVNTERKRLASALEAELRGCLAAQPADAPAVVISGIGWHRGLIGLAASHLMHEQGRPVVVITGETEDGEARGSVRADGDIDLPEILAAQADLLDKWGGHHHAAGFTLPARNIEPFRERFITAVGRLGGPVGAVLAIDAEASWSELGPCAVGSDSLLGILSRLAPYSEGNRPPVLACRGLRIAARRPMGPGDRHCRLVLADDAQVCREVLWWNCDQCALPEGRVDVAFTLSSNEWQGSTRLRLTLEGIRPHAVSQE
jgi:single-stranded-DNA-specific exonuclease